MEGQVITSGLFSSGTNVCKDNNGGCQQLCLYRGNGQRTCACAHGMLAEDGRTCRDYDGYLLYSERTILKSVHLSDENNLNAPIKPFEDPDHMKNVIALTFDYRGGGGKGANRIFYSDIHFGNIQQINDDGSDRKTVVDSESAHFSFPDRFLQNFPLLHSRLAFLVFLSLCHFPSPLFSSLFGSSRLFFSFPSLHLSPPNQAVCWCLFTLSLL